MGRLTGNFTGPRRAFLEAPVNFPDKISGCYQLLKWALKHAILQEKKKALELYVILLKAWLSMRQASFRKVNQIENNRSFKKHPKCFKLLNGPNIVYWGFCEKGSHVINDHGYIAGR